MPVDQPGGKDVSKETRSTQIPLPLEFPKPETEKK